MSRLPPLLLSLALLGWMAGGVATAENRLADTASDYLRDHADNPVDWYPWGEEALSLAREQDKPIFVSVGYSTCYWCHVAKRELYEDPEIAAAMNEGFINIKVDREQRPDLDRVLMAATRALGEGGGWPNNVFLTPELEPFFAGSYFPPEPLPGRESFPQILERLSGQWQSNREPLLERAETTAEALREGADASLAPERIDPADWQARAIEALEGQFDSLVGGFAPPGQSSRFPQSPRLALLLSAVDDDEQAARAEPMLRQTLAAMSIGALFDHVGGGFHRYTVDPEWAIPHFEKMLVDNAQLVGHYARAGQRLDEGWFDDVAARSVDYLDRRLWADEGGYFTAENAELDGIEGKSYVFTAEEIRAVLGEDAEAFLDWHQLADLPESRIDHELPDGGAVNLAVGRAYDAFEQGKLAESIAGFEAEYAALLEARQERGLPKRDRKQVAEFNALTGLGLLAAAQPLDRGDWQERAQAVGDWLWARLWDADEQHLYRQVYEGDVSGEAFLSDHAAAGRLMLALYGSSHDIRWLFRAQRIAATIERDYLDESGRLHERPPESGGGLPLSPPLVGDDAAPSGHSQAVVFLLDLGTVLEDAARQERAVRALAGFAAEVDAAPADWGFLVGALARPSRAEVVTREAARLAEATETTGGPGETRDHVEVEARLIEGGAAIVVRLAIDEGFHINANPASEDFLVPTRVTALDGEIGPIDYPPGKPFRAEFARSAIDVFEGVLELRVPVTGEMPTRLRLDLQACDDEVCLAPDEVEVEVE
ncbi:DUF255 domain-containing protein [Guyparkeria sp. SCN-R1]|uniref:DUF255 domain-containing protein n=1 Tax=Guyparkeria sp. SCN-R1 TaxID=2341113 RepID=UPI000F646341|nr:DUF255 domain-containing protein [Guyparkeria sp. SCN-R1]RRQ24513.1 DUF255 domain-containing protein [Guyparkeria sp. SCN-R1]